jgi:hypothetical protein
MAKFLLDNMIVGNAEVKGTKPPSGYYADEVAEANKLVSRWSGTVLDG